MMRWTSSLVWRSTNSAIVPTRYVFYLLHVFSYLAVKKVMSWQWIFDLSPSPRFCSSSFPILAWSYEGLVFNKKPEYSTDKIRYQLWASLLIHHFCWTRGYNFLTWTRDTSPEPTTHRPTLRMLGCFACKKSKKSTKVVTCQGKDPLVVKDRCW